MEDIDDMEASATVTKLKEQAKLLKKQLNLSSVLIICTRVETDDEGNDVGRRLQGCAGDYYACIGSAKDWLDGIKNE